MHFKAEVINYNKSEAEKEIKAKMHLLSGVINYRLEKN